MDDPDDLRFRIVLGLRREALVRTLQPVRRVSQKQTTIPADLFNVIGHGILKIKPNVQELCGDSVKYFNRSAEEVDLSVWIRHQDYATYRNHRQLRLLRS